MYFHSPLDMVPRFAWDQSERFTNLYKENRDTMLLIWGSWLFKVTLGIAFTRVFFKNETDVE